ncbi:MAG: tetratricopeptide repeat protein, partial [Desulfurella sp.]
MLFLSKRYKKAIKYCDSAASKTNSSAYFYLGKIYLNLNQPSTALDFFKKYKQLSLKKNTIGKAYKYIAISYLNLYLRYKYLYYKDNLINMPSNEGYQTNLYMSMNNLSALHLIHQCFNKTINYFHKSLEVSPINIEAKIFNDLAYAYFFDNKISKAL